MWLLFWWGCGLTSPTTTVGPIRFALPPDMEPIPLGSDLRDRMFAARYRHPEPLPDLQIVVNRLVPVPESWSEGTAPTAMLDLRRAVAPIAFEEGDWLGGRATFGVTPLPKGTTWTRLAVRSGWLAEVSCTGDGARAEADCGRFFDSVRLSPPAHVPPADAPLVSHVVGPLKVMAPSDWEPMSADFLKGGQLGGFLPPPTGPGEPWTLDALYVDVIPEVYDLEAFFDEMDTQGGWMSLSVVNREEFPALLGMGARTELTDGLSTTFAFDLVTGSYLVHVFCSGAARDRTALQSRCAKILGQLDIAPR